MLSIYIDLVILVSATSVCASVFTALCNFNHDRRIPVPHWLQNCCSWYRPQDVSRRASRGGESASGQASEASSPTRRTPVRKEDFSLVERDSLNMQPGTSQLHRPATLQRIHEETSTASDSLIRRTNLAKLGALHRHSLQHHVGRRSFQDSEETTCFSEEMPHPHAIIAESEEEEQEGLDWLDIQTCINYALGYTCFLAISLGPAIIFGVIPAVVNHDVINF